MADGRARFRASGRRVSRSSGQQADELQVIRELLTKTTPRMPLEAVRSAGRAVLPLLMVFPRCGMPVRQSSEAESGLLDPKQIEIGEIVYTACDGWAGSSFETQLRAARHLEALSRRMPPLERPIVVDIYFAGPGGNLSPEQEEDVTAHGGRVLYRYQLPVIRAEIRPSQVERLSAEMFSRATVNHVRSVPNPRRMDLEILVMYHGPIGESDLQRITKLGARVNNMFAVNNSLSAAIPDQSIRALRSDPSVIYVGYNGVYCLRE